MLKTLIAVDGSPNDKLAFAFAHDLLAGKETTVILLHVIPQHFVYGWAGAPAEVYDMPTERTASMALLDEGAMQLREAGVGTMIEKQLAIGDPADLILTAAEDHDADLIIMGSRGLNAASRFLLGSSSTKVTTHAHCAVLVVHPKEAKEAKAATTATVVQQAAPA